MPKSSIMLAAAIAVIAALIVSLAFVFSPSATDLNSEMTKPSQEPSASPSPSATPSASPSSSPLPSASVTPVASPSASPVPSASPSSSPSASVLPSASPVPSASPSPSATPSASPSASPLPSASPSVSPSDPFLPLSGPIVVPSDVAYVASCSAEGLLKDRFSAGEALYVQGAGFKPLTAYTVYVVESLNNAKLADLTSSIVVAQTSVTTNASGCFEPSLIWASAQYGNYDLILDANADSQYNQGTDAIDQNILVGTPTLHVIPEVPFGTIAALSACFAALAFIALKKNRATKLK
jgi:hypothetical protein